MSNIEEAMARHPAGRALPDRDAPRPVIVQLRPSDVARMRDKIDEAQWCTNGEPEIVLWQYLRLTGVME